MDLTEPDAKRRRQKHTADFKTEVLEKLAEGKTPKEVISIYRSFNINEKRDQRVDMWTLTGFAAIRERSRVN